jgi:hypothetical protein
MLTRQLCPPLFGVFGLTPGFIKFDKILLGFLCVRMPIIGYVALAFDGFEKKLLCPFVFVLLCIRYSKGVHGFRCCAMFLTVCNAS